MQEIFADWRSLMAGIQVWLSGGTPYGRYAHPVYPDMMVNVGWYAYPPPTLILATPLAILPWPLSSAIMLLVCIIGFERWVRKRSGRSGLPWLLLWLPFAQGLWIGQTTMLFLVSLLWAEDAATEGHDVRAALLLALALLKPQVGVLPAAWLLLVALRERRWVTLASFVGISAVLWGGPLLVSGPQIYGQWMVSLGGYDQFLPNRPLLFPPFGPLLAAMALLLWHRHGRGDVFGLALLVNTLAYPLSVIYVAVAVALVVIRWRPTWAWYPLVLSWIIPATFSLAVRTPDSIASMTQAIIATGLLAGLLPQIPWLRRAAND